MSAPPTGSPPADPPNPQPPQPIRLAIVTRRFWPYSGMPEMAVGDLATEIRQSGYLVDVFTIGWEKNWPRQFEFQELPVHRINRPSPGPWGSFRYLRALTRALVERNVDGIIVFGLGDEAWAVSKTFGQKIPFVIRIDDQLLEKRKRMPSFTSRQIAALNSAASVLVESEWMKDRITQHSGVDPHSIVVVRNGIRIPDPPGRTRSAYGDSRVAISDAHPVLMIGPTQPLVVCGAPLEGDHGWLDLIEAWPKVLDRFPKSRLWILGDGKRGRQIWERMLEQNLVHSIIMPGSFDDLDDVLQAADVTVHPLRSDENCGFLARALAAGVCSVVTSTQSTRSIVENNVNGLVVNPNDPGAMADAIILALSHPELRERLGNSASESSATAYDIKRLIRHYIEPLLDPVRPTAHAAKNLPATNPTSPT